MKEAVALSLKKAGFVGDVSKEGEGVSKELIVELKYQSGESMIRGVKRLSKPGRRLATFQTPASRKYSSPTRDKPTIPNANPSGSGLSSSSAQLESARPLAPERSRCSPPRRPRRARFGFWASSFCCHFAPRWGLRRPRKRARRRVPWGIKP